MNVVISWQLSKQVIRWPLSPDCTSGLSVDPSRSSIFEVIRWQITSFKWWQAQHCFFQWFKSNMLCLCHHGPALLGLWFLTDLGRENSVIFFQKYRRERPFLTMVTCWSCSRSNSYALIGQNLTGEFMRKIHAASWKLFTLAAEADRVLFQRVMFLIFSLWMYKLKYSCYQESSVYSWLVCLLVFWLRNAALVKFGNSISDGIVFVFHHA